MRDTSVFGLPAFRTCFWVEGVKRPPGAVKASAGGHARRIAVAADVKNLMATLALTCAATLFLSQSSAAQNLLNDGGFDGAASPTMGNNHNDQLPDWRFAAVIDPSVIFKNANNLVRVDGPGGFDYVDFTGDALGPESDASGAGANTPQFYIDSSVRGTLGWQYFTPSCSGIATGQIFMSNREGHGIGTGTLSGPSAPPPPANGGDYQTAGGLSIVQVNTQLAQFPGGPAQVPLAQQQTVLDLAAAHEAAKLRIVLGAGPSRNYPWTPFSVQVPVQAGLDYAFVAELGHSVNMDEASVTLDCDPDLPVINPQDVVLSKSCELEEAHSHNGILGQRWACQVDVTTPSAPFAGDITLHDVFANTPLVNGLILLGESLSGNGTCFQGDCLISGANFDPSGTESFAFDVFVEAVAEADVYPLENCVSGALDDGAGNLQPLTPHCTTGQWIPRSQVVKTCDPIPAHATAPYTMNCSIEVTASGLVGGTYVSVMDAFAAQPPSIATVSPTFMNVTSTENWNCIDHVLNTPSSIGICELPAEDLMAAGGTSTLDISFQFTVDQAPTQVANCRFTDIHTGSYLDQLNTQRSPLRSPIQSGQGQNPGWPQMPDGCVYMDVPAPQLDTKVDVKIAKDCDQPALINLNGTWGYLWQCEAEVEVAPAPFAGEVSFTDDGSQISLGASEFVSVSDPNNCQGIGTDILACTYDGATFSSPHFVQYDLFTPYVPTDEEILWRNCIGGSAVTPAGTFPSVPMCTGRVIKPSDVPVFDPVKEITLEKVCKDQGREMMHDGQMGLGWDCQIIVAAVPAPFAGSFTFTEDATSITGSTGQIIGIDQPLPAHWACAPNVPTPSTDCTIAGASFDPSGTETVDFTLFAPNTGEAVEWQNCVSGVYTPADKDDTGGTPVEVKGNCETITWKPPVVSTPPTFSLKKSCRGPFDQGPDGQSYSCKISVTQTGGDPITQPLTLNELFTSTTTGQPASQFMIGLQGSPGWACDMPTVSCTIQPADFNGTTGHQIGAFFLIPNGTLAQQDFENCAALTMDDAEVAAAPCVALDEPNGDPAFEVQKECKPLGERQVMGPSTWFQPWSCTLTVTSNGVPFTDPLWIDDNMLYGPHDGSQSVVSVSSNDPWQCAPAPYGPNGNQPVCGIQGSQFPHTTSTLNVTLNLFGGAADQFGAENCVALSMGQAPSSDPADTIAEDCFEIIPTPEPKEPQIDLVKTCEAATQTGTGLWTVECLLTITGQNLPNGQQFRVSDELMSSNTQIATFGTINTGTNTCGGGTIAGGTMAGCDLTTDLINNNGGTLTLPYTGIYQGPAGRPLSGPRAQNCAFVDVPGLGLHGPQGGNGKSCVPIEFKVSVTGAGNVLTDPEVPGGNTPDVGGPVVTGDPIEATGGVIGSFPSFPSQTYVTKTCDPLVFANGAQTATAHCNIEVGFPANSGELIYEFFDFARVAGASWMDIVQGPMPPVTGLPQLGCAPDLTSSFPSKTECTGPSLAQMSAGGVFNLDWSAELTRPVPGREAYENCVVVRTSVNGTPHGSYGNCHAFEVTIDGQKAQDSSPFPMPKPAPLQEPKLSTRKVQTSDCVPNRNTQRYSCGFQIVVANEGAAPFNGPLVVTDTFGSPYAQAITQTSAGGWSCAQPVAGSVSCEHAGLTLPAGSFAYIDLEMEVQGLVNGGQWENCAAVGIPNDRKQRVAAIQQVMNARGLAAGPVDGLPGKKTYAALAELQKSLGLRVTRAFDDALFVALGLPLAKPGQKACVTAELPPMPKPPLQCDRATTVQKGESCQCRYDNMLRRDATSCQCKGGFAFVAGEGCVKQVVAPKPEPTPPPLLETLTCDKRSTRLRGDQCVCLDPKNAVKTSETTCGCKNGGPMIGGKCLSIVISPKPGKPDTADNPVGTTEPEKCKVRINGICLK